MTTRFFFDIQSDGKLTVDDEGMEFSSLQDAQNEAVRSLGEIARDASRNGELFRLSIGVRSGDRTHVTAFLEIEVETPD